MSDHKVFDKDTYDQDDNAKDQFITYLANYGFTNPHVNPDQYGIDVLAERDGEKYAFEVEVKHNWDSDYFPFKTVHFSYRKIKFTKIPDISLRNTFFVMMNDARTVALRVDGVTFAAAKVVTKKTIHTASEKFAELPTEQVIFFRL